MRFLVSVGRHIVLLKRKRIMTRNMFISLLMIFTQNENTVPVIGIIGAFPYELKVVMNINNRK